MHLCNYLIYNFYSKIYNTYKFIQNAKSNNIPVKPATSRFIIFDIYETFACRLSLNNSFGINVCKKHYKVKLINLKEIVYF